MNKGSGAIDYICSVPWAIEPSYLPVIVQIAARENDPIEVVEARLGKKLDNTRTVTVRDGVAIIPVTGPIFRRANLFTRLSGATSVEQLALDLRTAVEDPNVKSILLNIDSPGGEANGINEIANQIAEAATQKPLVSYVGGLGASGAYWIASATDEIVIDDGAILGSIGVVMSAVDDKGAYEQRGIKIHTYTSSNAPRKRPKFGTESGDAEVQRTIDALESVFVESVARNRGVTVEKVLADFGQGGLLVGKAAVEAGLADRLGSFEALIAEMGSGSMKRKKKRGAAAGSNNLPAKGSTGGIKMSWLQKMKALLAEAETEPEAGADAGEEKPEIRKPARPASQASAAPSAPSAESEKIASLEKRIAEMEQAQHKAAAEAFINAQIQANKILPAEKTEALALLTEAMIADANSPLEAGHSRADIFKKSIESRPAHKLTSETLKAKPPVGARVLADSEDEEAKALEEIEASTMAYAKKANGNGSRAKTS